MVTPVGDLIVITSVALAGICLGSRLGAACTPVVIEDRKYTARVVYLRLLRNILGRNRVCHSNGCVE